MLLARLVLLSDIKEDYKKKYIYKKKIKFFFFKIINRIEYKIYDMIIENIYKKKKKCQPSKSKWKHCTFFFFFFLAFIIDVLKVFFSLFLTGIPMWSL